jgi:transposase
MRGQIPSEPCFISLINVETMIPAQHPIRVIKKMCDEVLGQLSRQLDGIYSAEGAPSIPPETLLKGKVLQALYTVRSDRQLCDRLKTDLLFRWFVDLPLDTEVFDASTYSKNQQRLLQHQVADLFFTAIVELARHHGWVSNEHFSVDGTLIEAWASTKSFRPKDEPKGPGSGNAWMDFKGEKRSNDTHESTTDAEAKLLRKGLGKEAKLCFGAHLAMENRHGLCVRFAIQPAVGVTETEAALTQIAELKANGFRPKTVGADKGYHNADFIQGTRRLGAVPHPALKQNQDPLRVRLTATHAVSQLIRKRIEELIGWCKTTGNFRKSRYRGVARTHAQGQYVAIACNLVRMAKLMLGPPNLARA